MKKAQHYMVVDDDNTNNLICEFTIRGFDKQARITLHNKPEEALSEIRNTYDEPGRDSSTVLFLDINMPGMTGWEFLDAFNELSEQVKSQFTIYVLTSAIDDFSEEARLYPIVSGFLSKPLKKSDLENIIGQLRSQTVN